MPVHTEHTFETAVEQFLIGNGWQQGNRDSYDRDRAMDTATVLRFVQATQPQGWEQLTKYYGADTEAKFLTRLVKEIELSGLLHVVRNGITDSGVKFQLAYFKPDNNLNPETLDLYRKNILTVTRQVHYSKKFPLKSIDVLLSLNGLPVATMELKNILTGQRAGHAIHQYNNDRDPKELLFSFKKRCLVHFAVDNDEASLTTRIDGEHTTFIPFNKGSQNGAGNPANPGGYRTEYLFRDVLAVDSWLEIIGRFVVMQKETITNKGTGKRHTKEWLIFPRYHQLQAVRNLAADAKAKGAGHQYLIQHSAGSGKSNTIAWLAYRLSSLYNAAEKRVFDAVVVVTDRKVLDTQLQDTIYQFEHKTGVVQRIDKNSAQLADAITRGTNIVITTLQKFPFAIKHIAELPTRTYAVIVDEAHGSQGGDASHSLKEVLSATDLDQAEREDAEPEEDGEDFIRESMQARGRQSNLSFFAFTATPKNKTLELFGTPDAEGKARPFHLYSMKQAIEEGFILDVLKNYTTYTTFFRLSKQIADDPDLNKGKASKAIGRFIALHPHNLRQKTEVMVEHFRNVTAKKIGGQAKAMVVTGSRLHALRYYLTFKEYIREKGYSDVKTLVAFSGTVKDDLFPDGITEPQLNGFGEKELPEKFGSDDYQLLLVADKYQTGFDQPLLHTMYVDKKLSGVKAVQTLSRLNRTRPGKDDTFVLDFANDEEIIMAAFQPYYQLTTTEYTDPNHLYDLKVKAESAQVYLQSEVDAFARLFYEPTTEIHKDQQRLYGYLAPAKDRYNELEEEQQDEFKKALTAFVRLYGFLAQIMPFQDIELEKLYAFGRYLAKYLSQHSGSGPLNLENEVSLEYYRLKMISERRVVLDEESEYTLDPTTEAGLGKEKENLEKLSEIIQTVNSRFGTDFTETDKLFLDQVKETLMRSDDLQLRARNNPEYEFKFAVEELFDENMVERMDMNRNIVEKVMTNKELREVVVEWVTRELHRKFNGV